MFPAGSLRALAATYRRTKETKKSVELFIPNMLIALREGVEAALIVGIIVAFLNKIERRDVLPKLWIAVIIAAAVPLGCGVYWTWGPYTITFQTQEILGGVLSLVAVAFVTWMIFWSGKNSNRMKDARGDVEKAFATGSVTGIIVMAVIAVIREGAETAIFVWATVKSSGNTGVMGPALGVLVGLILAIVIGYLVYKGAIHINLRIFFNVIGYLLIFVAAGILIYGINDLQEASLIPGQGTYLYTFAAQIAPVAGTWWFVLLNAFFQIQYILTPSIYMFIPWLVYLVTTLVLFTLQIKGKLKFGKDDSAQKQVAAQSSASVDGAASAGSPEPDSEAARS